LHNISNPLLIPGPRRGGQRENWAEAKTLLLESQVGRKMQFKYSI
jgi:hypothetical protein